MFWMFILGFIVGEISSLLLLCLVYKNDGDRDDE